MKVRKQLSRNTNTGMTATNLEIFLFCLNYIATLRVADAVDKYYADKTLETCAGEIHAIAKFDDGFTFDPICHNMQGLQEWLYTHLKDKDMSVWDILQHFIALTKNAQVDIVTTNDTQSSQSIN